MSESAAAVAGTNATAEQYNDLRTDAITRLVRFYFNIEGSISAATALQVITVPAGMTITKIKHRLKSGTATMTVKTVAGATIKSGISVTSSYASETTGLSNTTLAEGDELQIDFTAVSSADTLRVLVYCTETI